MHTSPFRASALLAVLAALATSCTEDATAPTMDTPDVFATEDALAASVACGIGFWKTHVDSEAWNSTGYAPDATVGSVFDGAEPYQGHTLAEALGLMGGRGVDGAKAILVRAAVGALLNAAHPDVDFGMTTGAVTDAVNAALGSGNRRTILALAAELDLLNDGSCGTASGEPDEPGLPDLVVTQVVFGEATATGLPRTVTIQNVGTAPVDVDLVSVQGFYSTDTILDSPGADAAACGRAAAVGTLILAPGESRNVTSNCGILPEREHVYLLVVVDYGEIVEESDESNNIGVAELPLVK